MADPACIIGSGIQVRGNLSGSGDLSVEGRMEGHVALSALVTVEQAGTVVADVEARELTVHGKMTGNADATDRILVTEGATFVGDIKAPRVVLDDGAKFRGRIEMEVPLPDDI
ncbi:MAG: polymer-forming cytoskeletal protein [Myxococcota bacterium]